MITGGWNEFNRNLGGDEEAKRSVATIIQKINRAAENLGLPVDPWSKENFDKWAGWTGKN